MADPDPGLNPRGEAIWRGLLARAGRPFEELDELAASGVTICYDLLARLDRPVDETTEARLFFFSDQMARIHRLTLAHHAGALDLAGYRLHCDVLYDVASFVIPEIEKMVGEGALAGTLFDRMLGLANEIWTPRLEHLVKAPAEGRA